MNKLLVLFVLVLVLGGGYYMMKGNSVTAPQQEKTTEVIAEPSSVMEKTESTTGASMNESVAKEVTVDSFEFGYDQKIITIKKGQTVKLTLTNSGKMPHDWVVDELTGAKTKEIKNGETDTVTFVAEKAGTFEYYCSVGSHRKMGMVGKLVVEE
jgi:plastocyanin